MRNDNFPENFAILRQMALNSLKLRITVEAEFLVDHLKCGCDTFYLLNVLAGKDAIALPVLDNPIFVTYSRVYIRGLADNFFRPIIQTTLTIFLTNTRNPIKL